MVYEIFAVFIFVMAMHACSQTIICTLLPIEIFAGFNFTNGHRLVKYAKLNPSQKLPTTLYTIVTCFEGTNPLDKHLGSPRNAQTAPVVKFTTWVEICRPYLKMALFVMTLCFPRQQ